MHWALMLTARLWDTLCTGHIQATEGLGPVELLGRTYCPPAGPAAVLTPGHLAPGGFKTEDPADPVGVGPEGLLAKEEPLFRNQRISLRTICSHRTAGRTETNSCCLKTRGAIVNVNAETCNRWAACARVYLVRASGARRHMVLAEVVVQGRIVQCPGELAGLHTSWRWNGPVRAVNLCGLLGT